MSTPKAAAVNLQDAPELSPQERLIQQLRTRNAELENTNRLLLREVVEGRRAEMTRSGGEGKIS
jgi:hypothetical protein